MSQASIEKIQLGDGTQEVVIRHGEAAPVREQQPIKVLGRISTVYDYLMHRVVDQQKAIIVVSKDSTRLEAKINPDTEKPDIIQGVLQSSTFADLLRINGNGWTDPSELSLLIRKNRHRFPNKEAVMVLIGALKNFQAKVEKEIQKVDEGSKRRSLIESLAQSNLPSSINVSLPIIEGEEETEILVTIEVHPVGGSAHIHLINDEWESLVEQEMQARMKDETDRIAQQGYLVIQQ